MGQHVAIKCTYNNGDEGDFVGFNETCSEEIIKWNIESGRVWCGFKDCQCRKYYDRGLRGKRPVNPCYESVLFRHWRYGAGWYHTGKRAGTPIRLSNVDQGKIAILTTRFPGDEEIDRKIIGFFKIRMVTSGPNKETMLIADREFAVRLPIEEAKELFFWDYYSTKAGARWNTLLIRYLNDNLVARILRDLRETLRDENTRAIVDKLIMNDFPKVPPDASGPRVKKSGNRIRRVTIVRKYGSTGEGKEHRKLKEWIAKHPEVFGLDNIRKTEVEYVFPSGDTADIVFQLSKNRFVVIEIETGNPLPGCYQVLKYKVLKCVELGLPITSNDVEAILVAWAIPGEVKSLCNKYGIRFLEKKI